MLVKMMPQLLALNQFFRLVIIGDGPDRKVLQAMIKNLGMERKIYLLGPKTKNEITNYMAAADMFLLNTGYESFSYQILEAMAAGVPLITTAVGGNLEMVRQGENGFLVKYNDEFNLIEAVKTLWASAELRDKFSLKGKKTALQYPPERTVMETKRIVEEL